MPRIYDPNDLPRRTRLGISAEMAPYVEAWRNGQTIGDGVAYETDRDARRVAMKFWARGRSALDQDDDPALSQRVWSEDGNYFWALIPRPNLSKAEQEAALLEALFDEQGEQEVETDTHTP